MDIDIDFPTNFDPRSIMKEAIPASMIKGRDLVKHPCGHYFQTIPVDHHTGLSAIPYEEAEVLGFFKIDFLHLSVLDNFKSKAQIRALIKEPPNWDILLDETSVSKLFQIHRNHRLLTKVRPHSVQELADCIALIRPGKRHLVDAYISNKSKTRPLLYARSDDGYYFKKSHAISYALTIVLQLHLIELGRL